MTPSRSKKYSLPPKRRKGDFEYLLRKASLAHREGRFAEAEKGYLRILQDWHFPQKFDLIYSSDVFVYFGNLDTIIRSASAYLVSGGIIAFSVERLENNSIDYRLFPSGCYAHSLSYIKNCLGRHGLQLKEGVKSDIRKQSGNPVRGLLIVANK